MKIVFLDFDGVLNHYLMLPAGNGEGPNRFNPPAVERLNTIVRRTGASVVVISSWRERYDVDALRALLAAEGYEGEVVDSTPVLHQRTKRVRDPNPGETRCQEIQQWLDSRPLRPESFVILDDIDLDMLAAFQVKTDAETGLLDEHVETAVSILGEA